MSLDTVAIPDVISSFDYHRLEPSIDRRMDADQWFTELYEQNSQWLLGFALRLTGQDRQRAQDLAQETLIRVWRFAPNPRPDGTTSLRPWLATIARRLSINEYRKALTRPPEYRLDQHVEPPGIADDTARILRTITITEAIGGLNPIHREILIEVYFRGHTVVETARLLHIAVGTAKSRLHTALRAMRQALLQVGDAGMTTG